MSQPFRKLSAHYVLMPQGLLRHAILSFDADGTLLAIDQSETIDREAHVEFHDGVLMPGMVNAHTHLELSYLRGRITRGCGFAGFADAIGALRHETPLEERVAAARYRDRRMAADGVVAVGDICNGSSTFDLKRQSTIRYHNFIEAFGLGGVDFGRVDRLTAEAREAGLPATATPHATYSVQDADFRRLCEASARLSIHFMESCDEAMLFEGRGALVARNRREGVTTDFDHYGSPTERVIACVPHDRPLLLVHGTFAGQEQIDRLQEAFGDRLTWVLCPRSNRFIEQSLPPVGMLRRTGCRIAVGTDSLASNDDLSLASEIACFPEVPLVERLGWLTRGGARALGIEAWAGDFTVGYRPGAVLLSGIDWRTMQLGAGAATRRIL